MNTPAWLDASSSATQSLQTYRHLGAAHPREARNRFRSPPDVLFRQSKRSCGAELSREHERLRRSKDAAGAVLTANALNEPWLRQPLGMGAPPRTPAL